MSLLESLPSVQGGPESGATCLIAHICKMALLIFMIFGTFQ